MQSLRHSALRCRRDMSADPSRIHEREQQLFACVWMAGEHHNRVWTHRMGGDRVHLSALLRGIEGSRISEERSALPKSWAAIRCVDNHGLGNHHLTHLWYISRTLLQPMINDPLLTCPVSRFRCVCEGQFHRVWILDMLPEPRHLRR